MMNFMTSAPTPKTVTLSDGRGEAARYAHWLGLKTPASSPQWNDLALAEHIEQGLALTSIESLSALLGRGAIVGPIVSEASLSRARRQKKRLSQAHSERLYELVRVVDAVVQLYRGDLAASRRFLTRRHQLLEGRTPLELGSSNAAGAQAVLRLVEQSESGLAV